MPQRAKNFQTARLVVESSCKAPAAQARWSTLPVLIGEVMDDKKETHSRRTPAGLARLALQQHPSHPSRPPSPALAVSHRIVGLGETQVQDSPPLPQARRPLVVAQPIGPPARAPDAGLRATDRSA